MTKDDDDKFDEDKLIHELEGLLRKFTDLNYDTLFREQFKSYQERVVDRYEDDENEIMVSTAEVTDSELSFETAVVHPDYNDGKIVIVDSYGTKESAAEGHKKWVKIITTEPLPEHLTEKGLSVVSLMLDFVDDSPDWRVFPRKKKIDA